MRSDRIELRGLRLLGICGVLPLERVSPQPLEVDLDLGVDLDASGASDHLADTVDYGSVCATVERVVTSAEVSLLEHLAARIVEAVLAGDERIQWVTVGLRKLRPPVPQQLDTSGVRLTRSRTGDG